MRTFTNYLYTKTITAHWYSKPDDNDDVGGRGKNINKMTNRNKRKYLIRRLRY